MEFLAYDFVDIENMLYFFSEKIHYDSMDKKHAPLSHFGTAVRQIAHVL
tara:strand:- start:1181 stop:1327 length:147 start_codon:yes stop_codon:yes gene_type:complete